MVSEKLLIVSGAFQFRPRGDGADLPSSLHQLRATADLRRVDVPFC